MTVQYLIDSENVGDFWIPLLELPADKSELIVFYTRNSPHMSYESLIRLKESDRTVTFIKCYEGTNALDFQLVSELGYLIGKNESGSFVIVTNDTGFDAAVKYWRRNKKSVKRITGKECKNLERRLKEDLGLGRFSRQRALSEESASYEPDLSEEAGNGEQLYENGSGPAEEISLILKRIYPGKPPAACRTMNPTRVCRTMNLFLTALLLTALLLIVLLIVLRMTLLRMTVLLMKTQIRRCTRMKLFLLIQKTMDPTGLMMSMHSRMKKRQQILRIKTGRRTDRRLNLKQLLRLETVETNRTDQMISSLNTVLPGRKKSRRKKRKRNSLKNFFLQNKGDWSPAMQV